MRDEVKLEGRRQKAVGSPEQTLTAFCLLLSLLSSLIPPPSSLLFLEAMTID
jgi:hypothetical protein